MGSIKPSDSDIIAGLTSSGISQEAIRSSLPTLGQQELRDLVTSASIGSPPSCIGIAMYPAKPAMSGKARTVFYTLAKELHLSGKTVHCLSVATLAEAIRSSDYQNVQRAQRVSCVFLLDFYEAGAQQPYAGDVSAAIRQWVRDRLESQKTVFLLSDATLLSCGSWWPASFLGLLSDRTLAREIK